MSFWKELSRRNVVKVGIAYAVAAWLIIHPVDIIFPILHLPEWSITLVAAFLIICFPFVLLFAWVYEITPKGLKKTKEVPVSKSITHLTGKRLNYIITGLLVVALAYFVFDKYYNMRGATTTAPVARTPVPAVSTSPEAKKSIAVLPFKNMSSDKEQESFVDGLSEELINTITQIPDLRVIARTSSFAFKGSGKTAQEISKELNVEYLLEGSVRKAGDDLRVTAQLISAADESHLWSKTYDQQLTDIFKIQEDIAAAVVNELKVTLGVGKSFKQLGGTENVEAYELYLLAFEQENIEEDLKKLDAAIALDPEFALAWVEKSFCHQLNSMMGPASNAAAERNASLSAALKAIELQPALPEGYAVLGNIKMSMGYFIEAASAYEKASELNIGPLWKKYYIQLLHCVAYFKKAHEILEEARVVDPLNNQIRAAYVENLGYLGDIQQAEKENERCMVLFGHDWRGNKFLTQARLGSGQTVTRDQIVIDEFWPSTIDHAAKEHLESPNEGLVELHRFYNDNNYQNMGNLTSIAYWAAYFGDSELSMDAVEKAVSIGTGNITNYWYPLFKEVRQLPRFKKLIRKIGIVDYWNKFGWPDICHKLDNGDFECD